MLENILYAILAILGLGFLVFIHELGHYCVARRQGMRIEVFAIGFGKPIYSWRFQGVKWQIGMLPFGGYVKIAGMHKEKGVEPEDIPDGFFGKTPWQRIKVAFAGPLVNIVFALVVFVGLWSFGGRDKKFAEFTHHIGWVDPKSTLYEEGIRPGDFIQKYSGRDFGGVRDLIMASLTKGKSTRIEGYKYDYTTNAKTPFDYTLAQNNASIKPAQYLIYDHEHSSSNGAKAGFLSQDRLIWVDGEMVFSQDQLRSLINDSTAFLTIKRGDLIFQTKVSRVPLEDLALSSIEKAEIGDWQYEAGLKTKFQDLYFIPYNLSPTGVVEGKLSFIDEVDREKGLERSRGTLLEGDQILAIDGIPIKTSYDLLDLIQTRRVLVIVKRDPALDRSVLWTDSDAQFEDFSAKDLREIVSSIGTKDSITQAGDLYLINPIVPTTRASIPLSAAQKTKHAQEIALYKKQIGKIQDPQIKNQMMNELEKTLYLGIAFKDRDVLYNPTPWDQFKRVFEDTWRTLTGISSGSINAKYLMGPVGIVHAVHQSWMTGAREALFWMAVISMNLGIANLLPIPVLDGGHIMFSVYEIVTRRRLSSKVMERMLVPFVGLMIGLFIYITYQDIARLFSKFF